jgi:phosphate transport system protein
MRERFDRKLNEMRAQVLQMGSKVDAQFNLALDALDTLDMALVQQIFEADKEINAMRYHLENQCALLIATQQPAAGDLRAIIAGLSIIVDLERMGDHAKGVAKVIPHMLKYPARPQPVEIKPMGLVVRAMLNDSMTAFAQLDAELAQSISGRDDEVDRLYGQIFTQIMQYLADSGNKDQVESIYEELRVAREFERFGDLATNIAERVSYIVTGKLNEINIDS